MDNLENNNLNFGANPKQNIKMENEFLELKLRAEIGAETHFMGNIPPEIQNIFLKNIIAFEQNMAKTPFKSVFEVLDKPVFPSESELNEHAIEIAYNSLIKQMDKKNISVFYEGDYDFRTKYKFITEELFLEEIPVDNLKGHVKCWFRYEEFHPNHALEIEEKTHSFISNWIEQKINEKYRDLSDTFTSPTGKIYHKDEITSRIKDIFKSYKRFQNPHYTIEDIRFDISKDTGLGFAEGFIKYKAVLFDNEEILIEGPFKLYFNLEYDWWSIFYFVFPGFE